MEEVDKEISEMKLFVRRQQICEWNLQADISQAECKSTFCSRVFLNSGRFGSYKEPKSCVDNILVRLSARKQCGTELEMTIGGRL